MSSQKPHQNGSSKGILCAYVICKRYGTWRYLTRGSVVAHGQQLNLDIKKLKSWQERKYLFFFFFLRWQERKYHKGDSCMEYCYAASIRAVGFKFWVMDWWHVTCELYYVVMNTQVNSCNDGAGNEHNNFAPNIVSFIICIYIICAGSFCFQKSWCNRFLFGFGSCSLFLSPSCSTRLFCRFLSVSSVDSTFAFS